MQALLAVVVAVTASSAVRQAHAHAGAWGPEEPGTSIGIGSRKLAQAQGVAPAPSGAYTGSLVWGAPAGACEWPACRCSTRRWPARPPASRGGQRFACASGARLRPGLHPTQPTCVRAGGIKPMVVFYGANAPTSIAALLGEMPPLPQVGSGAPARCALPAARATPDHPRPRAWLRWGGAAS
jgi:hypothetical protein